MSSGFDWQSHKRLLERTPIPEKVKCKICKKIRNQNVFSKRQLEELRKAIIKYGATGISGSGYAACRHCVGHQTLELTCCVCDKTKGLDCFSKNQRRDPDNARCTNCVQEHLDSEPIVEQNKQLQDEEDGHGTSAYQSQIGDYTVDSLHTLSITGEENHRPNANGSISLLDDDYISNPYQGATPDSGPSTSRASGSQVDEEDLLSMGGGVWVEQGRRRQPAKDSAQGDGGIPYTAYDPQGRPHDRTVAPPSESGTVRSGWESWGIAPSGRAGREVRTQGPATRRNPGFAKIPGGRVPKNEGPTQRHAEPTGPTIESDDEDDDDDIQQWI